MRIEILNRKKLKDDDCGVTTYLSKNRIEIKMSLEQNPTVAAYGSTLLHELLHAWLAVVKMNGGKLNSRNEHKFIYAVESNITDLLTMLRSKCNEKKK